MDSLLILLEPKLSSHHMVLWLSALLALGVVRSVAAEDYLVSRRHLSKRGPEDTFNISVFHVNDIHAHLDELRESGTDCTPAQGCFGGYARIKGEVDARRKAANNSLFLNMGDEFQGTLFYSYYGGEKIAETLNQLNFDAMTLGNHEFDQGDEYLGLFLKNLTMPIVCANVQSEDKNINTTVKPYHVFPEYKLAVVAVTTETIPSISNPDDNTSFPDPVSTAQYWADYAKANEKEVERVILMTHIGYTEDIRLAQNTKGIYAIFGGHSHTLLGDMQGATGKYPTIVNNLDGEEVFIVQAWRYGVYLGYIDLQFDASGRVIAYTGGPVHLTNTTTQDQALQTQIKAWRGPFEEYAAVVLGNTTVTLEQSTCQKEECLLGDVMCDAMLENRLNQSSVDACIINAGGIRATIEAGNITRGQVLTAFPFGNTITELKFKGSDLLKIFEGIMSGVSLFDNKPVTSFAQVSRGLRITYNPQNASGKRLIKLEIGQETLQQVEPEKEYTIVTLDFLAGGGDNFWPAVKEFAGLSTQAEVLTDYFQRRSPITAQLEGRIVTTTQTAPAVGLEDNSNGALRIGAIWFELSVFLALGFIVSLL